MKKLLRIVTVLCLLIIAMSSVASAAEVGSVMNTYTGSDSVVLFVKKQGGEIEQTFIGTEQVPDFKVTEAGSTRTIVLLDNSLSINKKYRDRIKNFLTDLVAARQDGDTFTIAVFAKDINYLVQDSNDYMGIKAQIDALSFVDQDSYLTNSLYTAINDINGYEEEKYTRVIVIGDGVDNEALGYTDDELNRTIRVVNVPIYTIGCSSKSNAENLKKMFALSRTSNAKSYLLDEVGETDILTDIFQDSAVERVEIKVPEGFCDGSEKSVRVTYGEDYCTAEIKMPFKATVSGTSESAEEPEEAVAEEKTVEEETKQETEAPTSLEGKIPFRLILLAAGVVAMIMATVAVFVVISIQNKKKKAAERAKRLKLQEAMEKQLPNPQEQERTEVMGASGGNDTDILVGKKTVRLKLQDVNDPSKTFECSLKDKVVVGKSAGRCQIVIDYNKYVSSVHCEIFSRENGCYVRDGGENVIASTNGTFVNGQKAAPEHPLPSGSILKVGPVSLKVTYK